MNVKSLEWLKKLANRFTLAQTQRVLVALFVSFTLFTSTACAGSTSATEVPRTSSPNTVSQPRATAKAAEREVITKRGIYNTTQQYQGGMNGYADDPQYDRNAADAKARKLIDRAEKNLQNRATSPQELIENITSENVVPDQARKASENLSDSIEQTRKELVNGAQQGSRNLKSNLERAKDEVPSVFDRAVQNAKGATQDIQQGAEDLGKGAQRVLNRAADEIAD
ncbi:MAG: hypothetical protein OHK0037_30790 [Elainellaceae cyanobacterium]